METAAWEFHLRAIVKGEVSAFNLEWGFLLFCFQEKEDRDTVLQRLWVVSGLALAVEPWRL